MSIEKYFSRPAKKAQINLGDSAQVDTVDAIVQRSTALDEEIIKIREEIHRLTNKRHVLSSTLLSSTSTQTLLRRPRTSRSASPLDPQELPVISSSRKHATTNLHRLAFSATSFPFTDPSPHTDAPNLLGVRIDVGVRGGKYAKPYYLLLQRIKGEGKDQDLRIHRHTIPVFIPLKALERRYLPLPQAQDQNGGVGNGNTSKPWKKKAQDLSRLVRDLRQTLVAWHRRQEAVALIREQLGLPLPADQSGEDSTDAPNARYRRLGIDSIVPTSIETRYVRIEWRDGRVGRIKLSDRGYIERGIVIGDIGRDKSMENILTGGDGRVEGLVARMEAQVNSGK